MARTLADIYKSHIALSKDDIETALGIVKNIILIDFIDQMKQVDIVFATLYHSVYCTGSFYEGLKIIKPNEFDLNLILNIQPQHFELISHKEDGNVSRGFAKYRFLDDYDTLEKKFKCDRYLSPKLLRNWFKGVFTKAFDKLNTNKEHDNYLFEYTESGPAMTIRIILKDSGDKICIDLVPVIPAVKKYLVPKLHPTDDLLWRLSYPNDEKNILENKNVAKYVIKLLKLLYRNSSLQKLCSYYIKMLVMLEVDGISSWEDTEIENYILMYIYDMLLRLQEAMSSGVLPSVHDREFNLFYLSDLNAVIRKNNYGQLKKIIGDFLNGKYEKCFIGREMSRFIQQSSYEISESDLTPNVRYGESRRIFQQLMDFKDLEDLLEEELPPPPPHTLIRYDYTPMGALSVGLLNTGKHEYINRRDEKRVQRRIFDDMLQEVLPPPGYISFANNVFVSLCILVVCGLLAMGAYYIYSS